MRRSLMNCQMMRVISSPSSSTTGLTTLILPMRRSLQLSGTGAPGSRTATVRPVGPGPSHTGALLTAVQGTRLLDVKILSRFSANRPHRETGRPFSGGAPLISTHLPGGGGKMPPDAGMAGHSVRHRAVVPTASRCRTVAAGPGLPEVPTEPDRIIMSQDTTAPGAPEGFVDDPRPAPTETVAVVQPSLLARLGAEVFGTFFLVLAIVGVALYTFVSQQNALAVGL